MTQGTTYTVSATGDPKWGSGSESYYLSLFVAAGNKGLGAVPIGWGTTTLTAGGPGADDAVAFFIDNGGTGDNSGTANIIFDDGTTPIPFSADGSADSSDITQDQILGRVAHVQVDHYKSYRISATGTAKWGDGPNDYYTSVIFSRGNNAYVVPIGGSTTVVSHAGQGGEDVVDFFFLDFGDVTAGEGKADNSGSVTITITEVNKPDLTITDIWWEPENPQSGDKVTFSYTVKNQGTDTPSGFDVRLLINSSPQAVSAVSSLAAGESKDGSFTPTWTATNGSHKIRVEADSGEDIEELDDSEWSNVMKKDLWVNVAPADLSIIGIEVTQAIQNLNNDVPLIAGKDTYVLVYTKSSEEVKLTGKLFRINGADRAGPEYPLKLKPPQPHTITKDIDYGHRINPEFCLIFKLRSEWAQGDNIRFEVEVTGGNNTITNKTKLLSFEEMPPLQINKVYVEFIEDGKSYKSNWDDYYEVVYLYLKKMYPINDIITWYRGDLLICYNPTSNNYNAGRLLETMKRLWTEATCNGDPDADAIWLGLVDSHIPYGEGDTRGLSKRGAPYCWAIGGIYDNDDEYVTVPHEFGHVLGGFKEVECPKSTFLLPQSYPFRDGRIGDGSEGGYIGFEMKTDDTIYRWDPLSTYDVMTYCDPRWISNQTYKGIKDGISNKFSLTSSHSFLTDSDDDYYYFMVSGIINTTSYAVSLDPIYRITRSAPPVPIGAVGFYSFELQNNTGYTLLEHFFDLGESSEPSDFSGFVELIPALPNTSRIILKHNLTELVSVNVSDHAPNVTVVSPNGGETLSGIVTINWSASDLDGDELYYIVEYSPDNGSTWQTLVMDINETSFQLNTSYLQGSSEGLIRVMVSDGVNTASDVSDSVFTVPKKVPEVVILSPSNGTTVIEGSYITLSGVGFDLEDGMLNDSSLTWNSDQMGLLGTGSDLYLRILGRGVHAIISHLRARTAITIPLQIRSRFLLSILQLLIPQWARYGSQFQMALLSVHPV